MTSHLGSWALNEVRENIAEFGVQLVALDGCQRVGDFIASLLLLPFNVYIIQELDDLLL